jgi:hypothetical protein
LDDDPSLRIPPLDTVGNGGGSLPDDPGPSGRLHYLIHSRPSSRIEWMTVLDVECARHTQKHNGGRTSVFALIE